jgi:hypothetical protein
MSGIEKIEELLHHFRINQKDFAGKCGFKSQIISDIRFKNSEISKHIIKKISNAFPEVNKNWLLDGEEPMLNNEYAEINPDMGIKTNLLHYLNKKNISKSEFYQKTGIANGFLDKKDSVTSSNIARILNAFEDLSSEWLLMGDGKMIRNTDNPYSINEHGIGVPYYDVDFINGFDLVDNEQQLQPAYYIHFQQYEKAEMWANATGQSMKPLINHGDKIAIRKLENWNIYLLYGEVYGIITDEYRTIKYVRKSKKGDDYLLLVPANEEFDEQDIPKSIIHSVYQILGCAKII